MICEFCSKAAYKSFVGVHLCHEHYEEAEAWHKRIWRIVRFGVDRKRVREWMQAVGCSRRDAVEHVRQMQVYMKGMS